MSEMDSSPKSVRITPPANAAKAASNFVPGLGTGSKRRHATLYDAVAGKVSYDQGLRSEDVESPHQPPPKIIKYSTRENPLAPDEVLFRRKDAPERYYEHDIYHSHERDLPAGGSGLLPESDLLKAVHTYASAFYDAKQRSRHDPVNASERSMDESALLAFGVLLEEAGKDALGRHGDQVFTEGEEQTPAGGLRAGEDGASGDVCVVGHHDVALRRGPKRRKVTGTDDEDE